MGQIWKSLRSFCTRPNRNQNVPESTEENKHCVQYIHILEELCWLSTFAVTIFPNFCISWILFPNEGDENEEKLREWKRHICSYTGIYFWICLDIFVLTLSFISGYIWIYLFLQWVLFPVRKFRIYFDIFVHTLGLILDIFWSILIYLFIVKVDTSVYTLGFISGYICS